MTRLGHSSSASLDQAIRPLSVRAGNAGTALPSLRYSAGIASGAMNKTDIFLGPHRDLTKDQRLQNGLDLSPIKSIVATGLSWLWCTCLLAASQGHVGNHPRSSR